MDLITSQGGCVLLLPFVGSSSQPAASAKGARRRRRLDGKSYEPTGSGCERAISSPIV